MMYKVNIIDKVNMLDLSSREFLIAVKSGHDATHACARVDCPVQLSSQLALPYSASLPARFLMLCDHQVKEALPTHFLDTSSTLPHAVRPAGEGAAQVVLPAVLRAPCEAKAPPAAAAARAAAAAAAAGLDLRAPPAAGVLPDDSGLPAAARARA